MLPINKVHSIVQQQNLNMIKKHIRSLYEKTVIHPTMNVGQRVKEQALQRLSCLNLNKASTCENINQALSSARASSYYSEIAQSLGLSGTAAQSGMQGSRPLPTPKETLSTKLLKSKTDIFKTIEAEKEQAELRYSIQKQVTSEEQKQAMEKLAVPKKRSNSNEANDRPKQDESKKNTDKNNVESRYMEVYQKLRTASMEERKRTTEAQENKVKADQEESKQRMQAWEERNKQLKELEQEILKKDKEMHETMGKDAPNYGLTAFRRAQMQLNNIPIKEKQKTTKDTNQGPPLIEKHQKQAEYKYSESFLEFEQRQKNAYYERQRAIDNLKNLLNNQEKRICTYKPEINNKFKFSEQQKIFMNMSASDRLYLQAKLKHDVKKAWEQIQTSKPGHFSPKINKTPSYIEEMAKQFKQTKQSKQLNETSSPEEKSDEQEKPKKLLTEDQYMELTNRLYLKADIMKKERHELENDNKDELKKLASTRHIGPESMFLANRREHRKWDSVFMQLIEYQQQNCSIQGSMGENHQLDHSLNSQDVLVTKQALNFLNQLNFPTETHNIILKVLEKHKTLRREEFFVEVINAEKKQHGYIV